MQRKKKVIVSVLIILIIFMILGLGYYALSAGGFFNSHESDEEETEYSDETTALYFDGTYYSTNDIIKSYLIIGTDGSGSGKDKEDTDEYRGTLADFLLLLVEDKTTNTYGFLQLDRNTITDVNILDKDNNADGYTEEQICCAHWYGTNNQAGTDNTIAAVEYVLGDMEINGYYEMNMDDIGKLNHLVDGVEVTLDEDFTSKDPSMKKGTTLTLSDEQAEIYLRGRYGLKDERNTRRMKRQRAYMSAFFKKIRKVAKEDPASINTMYKEMSDVGYTNIKANTLSKLASDTESMKNLGILTIDGTTKEGTVLKDGEVHEEFYPDNSSLIKVMSKLMNLTKDKD